MVLYITYKVIIYIIPDESELRVLDNKEINLVEEVNKYLGEGKTISEIEMIKGFGKDTLRKKLRKLNYKFDRKQKLYVLDITDNTKTNVINNTNNVKTNIKNKNESKRATTIFSENEIKILKEMIKIYEHKNKSIDNLDYKSSPVVVRSFRSYEKILDTFASFCKKNELNQKDAIATALVDFMKKDI